MKPLEVKENIFWVGAIDWNIRDFHGYATERGTTYNAFLILDEQITLIDTVKKEFADQLLERVSQIVDPKKIDIVISNHTEMDHSGGLPRVMHRIGENKPLYCSQMGAKNLSGHFPEKWNLRPVENGGQLSLGKRTLVFLETRMLHWPDSMFTYDATDKVLFSSDAFGQHYAGLERFDDEIGAAIMPHALKYYANILTPYSALVTKLLEKVAELKLDIQMICPDHGILWRKDLGRIVEAYARWAKQKPTNKAVVVYDTMWHSTQSMAEAIVAGLGEAGVDARPMHLRSYNRSEVITEVFEAGAVLVGSPTLNNGLFPTVSDFLTYMKGLKLRNKLAAAFGSYGWSGESVKLIAQELQEMKLEVVDPGLAVKWVPRAEDEAACMALGKKIGAALPEFIARF